jgi:tetratricopeptide (TPR) repeat protein
MRSARTPLLLVSALVLACANPDRRTLADLHRVQPDVTEVQVQDGLDQAMLGYKKFLEGAPESVMTPEAMRRLADLKLEKEFGILGQGGGSVVPAPEPTGVRMPASPGPARMAYDVESDRDFERTAAGADAIVPSTESPDVELPGGEHLAWAGPLEAIELYDRILETYPTYEYNDWVLYQKARAYDELGRTEEAIAVIERLVRRYPSSRYTDEVQFRRAEYFFTRKKFLDAEEAYAAITAKGDVSEYYELALYKLGWTLYMQDLHDEALDQYIALLDYKLSLGYDFDQSQDEMDERRIADTFRVISLSFSSLGGPDAVETYFVENGQRRYEDRIYSQLGEFYLDKLRYNDAAVVYKAFVGLHPLHRVSPRFSMRVVEIYEAGGFPRLVLESKKEYASRYGLQSDYWLHFDANGSPEVLGDLKSNLEDLANHYHALYQEEDRAEERPESFQEALHWYRAYLASFPQDPETPSIHYRLADLLLEHEDFGEAAREYERTAYAYPAHEQSAAAGYAAIYAHRENEKRTPVEERPVVTREAVTCTLRFVDTFPQHEHAAVVLGAAADDLYDMKQLVQAMATAHRLIDAYPEADLAVRRSAWAVVAHSSFDLGNYEPSEQAYARVLGMTPEADESRQAVVDSLAAAIYKQGEQAGAAEDHRAAADHFLRIAQIAPTSDIRPVAEYDAAAALIRLEDWAGSAAVLEAFRKTHPAHDLHKEATKQMAFVYREQGNDSRAAEEYERVAAEADDVELRREALLLAGELYESAQGLDRAIAVYQHYVSEFPEPLEVAVETRFKIAGIHNQSLDESSYHAQLREIVEIDEKAGSARTPRIRYLAAQSALVLSEGSYARFRAVKLVQPFEKSLQKKQARMDAALEAFEALVNYEAAEVTAAATFYMAEIYFDFSQSLMNSERPTGLDSPQMNDYEMVLEEEAFPFEERAIEVHKKNLELLSVGIFNPWIEKSLEKLATLMPGRYAKFEMSTGLIASIDRYAYRAPNARSTGPEEPELDDGVPSPAPESDAEVESVQRQRTERRVAAR